MSPRTAPVSVSRHAQGPLVETGREDKTEKEDVVITAEGVACGLTASTGCRETDALKVSGPTWVSVGSHPYGINF